MLAAMLVVAALAGGALILRSRIATGEYGRKVGESGSGVPDGYRTVTEDGFSVAIPAGWTRRAVHNSVFWDSPDTKMFLQIDRTPWAGTPAQKAYASDGNAPSAPDFPGYALTGISSLRYQGADAADWEFTFDDPNGRGPVRARDRFLRVGGRSYALYFRAPESTWSSSAQSRLAGFYETFRIR